MRVVVNMAKQIFIKFYIKSLCPTVQTILVFIHQILKVDLM